MSAQPPASQMKRGMPSTVSIVGADGTITREGDVISPTRAVLTLSKAMFNAGCFSLPYAWKLGGLWMSLAMSLVVTIFNWYGNHILVNCTQHLSRKTGRSALDYGHFAKKVCDNSESPLLKSYSKAIMNSVNWSILLYQLGMCAVSILFISDNMAFMLPKISNDRKTDIVAMATLAMIVIIFTNMFIRMKAVSVFALVSSLFFVVGAVVIMQFCVMEPSHRSELPAITDFNGVIMMIGIIIYSFEGQTMILPVENKLRTPADFLKPCGVLTITMIICCSVMTAIGYYGYVAFGDATQPTITTNIPSTGMYASINVCLMLQAILGHSIALYVVIDMLYVSFETRFCKRFPNFSTFIMDKLFRLFWVLVTYLMAIMIPKLEIMMPLIGITCGTLCAFVYPPFFEMITFWEDWKTMLGRKERCCKITLNVLVIIAGILCIIAGVYSNTIAIIDAFSAPESNSTVSAHG